MYYLMEGGEDDIAKGDKREHISKHSETAESQGQKSADAARKETTDKVKNVNHAFPACTPLRRGKLNLSSPQLHALVLTTI